jgi:hypothetical protein
VRGRDAHVLTRHTNSSVGRTASSRRAEPIPLGMDIPMKIGAGAIVAIVAPGLFLSAAGIFSDMPVSVVR